MRAMLKVEIQNLAAIEEDYAKLSELAAALTANASALSASRTPSLGR